MTVVWRPAAIADQDAAIAWIAEQNPVAAVELLLDIRDAARSLDQLPRRGRPGRVIGTRELVIRSNYILVYEIVGDTVTILRLWHAKQARR